MQMSTEFPTINITCDCGVAYRSHHPWESGALALVQDDLTRCPFSPQHQAAMAAKEHNQIERKEQGE